MQPPLFCPAGAASPQGPDGPDGLRCGPGGEELEADIPGVAGPLQGTQDPGKGDLRFRLSEERTADFSRAAPAWFRSLMKKEPKPFRILK